MTSYCARHCRWPGALPTDAKEGALLSSAELQILLLSCGAAAAAQMDPAAAFNIVVACCLVLCMHNCLLLVRLRMPAS